MVSVHLSVEHERAAGGLRADRLYRERASGRRADYRMDGKRGSAIACRGSYRAQPAPASTAPTLAGLTIGLLPIDGARKKISTEGRPFPDHWIYDKFSHYTDQVYFPFPNKITSDLATETRGQLMLV